MRDQFRYGQRNERSLWRFRRRLRHSHYRGFVSTLLYFHLINDPHSHPNSIESLAVVLAPALLSFGYVFYFIVNRPKRFRHDWLDGVLNGPNYNHLARRPIRHPFEKVRNKTRKSQQKSLT